MSTNSKSDLASGLGPFSSHQTWTELFGFVYGGYRWLNSFPIHYFMGSMSVKNLWDNVSLMSEMREIEKWGYEALFQRNINKNRVDAIHQKYLSDSSRVKFFPPITLALMPCVNFHLQPDYGARVLDTTFSDDGTATVGFDGLRIRYLVSDKEESNLDKFPRSGRFCRLEWDSGKFSALAIDGQHRVAALKKFVDRAQSDSHIKDVPVILLFVDPGWLGNRNLLEVTREIFIDINKNARQVDDSRLILLDDRNFYHSLTRQMISQSFDERQIIKHSKYESASINFDGTQSGLEILHDGIPQELIDVTMGKDAPDIQKLKPWQLTSAFILNRAIQFGFFFKDEWKEFEKVMDTAGYLDTSSNEVHVAIARRRAIYDSNDLDDSENSELLSINDSEMLSFNPEITRLLVAQCLSLWGVLLKSVFTAFSPYREFIEKFLAVSKDRNGDDIRLLMIAEGAESRQPLWRTSLAQQLEGADPDRFKACKNALLTICKPLGWDSSLVWYSVFQIALLTNLRILKKYVEKVFAFPNIDGSSTPLSLSREGFAEIYLRQLNFLFSQGIFDKNFSVQGRKVWHGICLKGIGADAMDGSMAAGIRLGKLIHVLVCASYVREKLVSETDERTLSLIGCAKTEIVNGYLKVHIDQLKLDDPSVEVTKAIRDAKRALAERQVLDVFAAVRSL